MDVNADQSWRRQGLLYPTMLIAAIAVIIFSVVGIAAMTGLLPAAVSGYRAPEEAAPVRRPAPHESPRALDAPRETPRAPQAAAPAVCADCGMVEAVRTLERKGDSGMLGAGAGAVVGGLLGNQIGGGSGRAVATIAGASAGALAGNEIERNMNKRIIYQVRVRMADGTHRNHYQSTPPKLSVGQRVRVSNGQIVPD